MLTETFNFQLLLSPVSCSGVFLELVKHHSFIIKFILIEHKIKENSYQILKRSPKERHTQAHGNSIEIFQQSQTSFSIRREWMFVNTRQSNHSLLIEKDVCDRQNISIKFPCVCMCLSSRVFPFCVIRTSVLSFPRGHFNWIYLSRFFFHETKILLFTIEEISYFHPLEAFVCNKCSRICMKVIQTSYAIKW